MGKKIIAAFDFDGTITTKDTFREFIRFVHGKPSYWGGILLHFPWLIAYKLGLYPNWKIKQRLFSFFFKGMDLRHFDRLCSEFCQQSTHLIRNRAIMAIQKHRGNNDLVLIVSASVENWVYPFAERLEISAVIATKAEVDNQNRLTGRFISQNCHGKEKVERLLQLYPQREEYHLVAYGDSKGDKQLLKFADEKFYRSFR
jgi:HAD superfamily hydrolase (TIGR01490 family)